jgi:hypothetical protein
MKAPSPDLKHEISTASSFPQRGELLDRVCKPWDQQQSASVSQFYPIQCRTQCFICSPYSDGCRGHPEIWTLLALGDTNWRLCGADRNLPSPQAVKLLAAKSSSQYTKKGSFYSENSTGEDTPSSYKRLQLVDLDLSSNVDQAQALITWANASTHSSIQRNSISTWLLHILPEHWKYFGGKTICD